MKILLDADDLRPIVAQVVAETVARVDADREHLDGKLAYPEAEAASLLGVARHVLRDARLRGEIVASRIGKRVLYSREELLKLLDRKRI